MTAAIKAAPGAGIARAERVAKHDNLQNRMSRAFGSLLERHDADKQCASVDAAPKERAVHATVLGPEAAENKIHSGEFSGAAGEMNLHLASASTLQSPLLAAPFILPTKIDARRETSPASNSAASKLSVVASLMDRLAEQPLALSTPTPFASQVHIANELEPAVCEPIEISGVTAASFPALESNVFRQIDDALQKLTYEGADTDSAPGRVVLPPPASAPTRVRVLTVDLAPKSLGAIRIRLHSGAAETRIEINVENALAMRAIGAVRDDLLAAVQASGMPDPRIELGRGDADNVRDGFGEQGAQARSGEDAAARRDRGERQHRDEIDD